MRLKFQRFHSSLKIFKNQLTLLELHLWLMIKYILLSGWLSSQNNLSAIVFFFFFNIRKWKSCWPIQKDSCSNVKGFLIFLLIPKFLYNFDVQIKETINKSRINHQLINHKMYVLIFKIKAIFSLIWPWIMFNIFFIRNQISR